MKTMQDTVLEHANAWHGSTGTCMDFLEVEHKTDNYAAGNLYMEALNIITAAQAENAKLRTALKDCMSYIDVENLTMQTKYREWQTSLKG